MARAFLPITAWDARVAARALALGALAFAVAWLVTAATDEGNVAWGVRAGRTLPLTPACAAIGTLLALAAPRARGDVRGMETLGRAPWANAAGATAGGALTALFAALAMAAHPSVDVTGFFPVAQRAATYVYVDGGFVDRTRGVRVEADGALARLPAETGDASPSIVPPRGRAAAATATALSGCALPLLAAMALLARAHGEARRPSRPLARGSTSRAVLLVGASAGATVLLFHAAAAGRVGAMAAAIPAALLLAIALFEARAAP